MDILRRASGPVLLVGGAAILVSVPFGLATGIIGAKELPWLSLGAVFVGSAAYVRSRRPDEVITWWFAIVGGLFGVIQGLDGLLAILTETHAGGGALAMVSLGYHLGAVAAVVAVAHLIGLFPDGEASPPERRALRALVLLYAAPPLATVARTDVALPYYHDTAPVENPLHLAALGWLEPIANLGITLVPTAFLVGAGLLILRYRRGDTETRRRIRWLLLPVLFAGFAALVDSMSVIAAPAVPRLVVDVLWLSSLVALPLSLTIAVLRPTLLDVDRILRRSLVYGSLWTLIAIVYVTAAATLGMAAGQRFDVGVAIMLTVAATLVFQPARARLERLADRWVFGPRADPARIVARLGATLAQTFDLETLLPHIAETLRQGLGARWVVVRLEAREGGLAPEGSAGVPVGANGAEPALTVPIVLGTERLGEVRCGPKSNGTPVTEEDLELVTTLARQAALAVRNVKLTAELTERLEQLRLQTVELEHSRARLVRAQETERRRIERNIHDGVQQDLVVLLGHTGRLRNQLARDPATAEPLLHQLQAGLQRVLGDLRELARGIHPTLLTDRGLLEAVEALAARSPLPVTVQADPALRGLRFPEEVEGAGYFTIAEALTNVLKHSGATGAEVRLRCSHGQLVLEVRDDGGGIRRTEDSGDGLSNLAARLAALGGRLEVASDATGTTVRALLEVDEVATVHG